jgi:hypothetical protein
LLRRNGFQRFGGLLRKGRTPTFDVLPFIYAGGCQEAGFRRRT